MADESGRPPAEPQDGPRQPDRVNAQVKEAAEAADEQMEEVAEAVEEKVAETLHRKP